MPAYPALSRSLPVGDDRGTVGSLFRLQLAADIIGGVHSVVHLHDPAYLLGVEIGSYKAFRKNIVVVIESVSF